MTRNPESTTVLVTGAGGFIASHCILQLLQGGYSVRGTLRDSSREAELREALAKHVDLDRKLEFVLADLLEDEGWEQAAEGCDFVIHVASPFPAEAPKHENDVIVPARDGTLRVLRAAAKAGAHRVVITSSLAAIVLGHRDRNKRFDENDWSNLNGKVAAYSKSKTLAERAAWEFVNDSGKQNDLELAVINPGYVLGPSIDGRSFSASGEIVKKLMLREVPGTGRFKFLIVDVRDIAAAHITAMISEKAAGRRYVAVSSGRWLQDIALTLKSQFESRGYRVPTRMLPDIAIRFVALYDGAVKSIVGNLGWDIKVSTERIESELNWNGREPEETIITTAESMIEHGIV